MNLRTKKIWIFLFVFFLLKNTILIADEKNNNASTPYQNLSENSVLIEGDSLESILDRKLRATGNASILKGNQSITADFIEYDQISEELYAKGQIKITTPDLELKGSELEMSLTENTGSIANASFVANINEDSTSKFNKELRGTATKIFLEGEDRKKLENAKVTTCEAGQNEWFISSDETVIDQSSGNIKAKDAVLSLRGIPIMYSPYVDFSTTSQRRSGWLLPTAGSTTTSGFEMSIPYYFNLSPTHDATITTRNMAKRGLQLDGEYRYLSENFAGTSQIQYLNKDKESDIDNRYLLDIRHKHNFGHGFTGTIEYEKVKSGDNNYFADMSTSIAVTSQVSLRQTAHLDYNKTDDLSDIKASLKVQEFQNLTSASPYELKPSFNVSFKKDWENKTDQSLFLQTDANFMYDQFDTGNNAANNIATGSRVASTPSISFPIEASFGYLKPKLIANLRHYDLDDAQTSKKSIAIPTVSLDSGLYLDRPFELSGYNFIQTLEPRVFYTYTPYEDQTEIPMFDTSLNELNSTTIFQENQFSGQDRVMDTNAITTALTTRILDDSGYDWALLTMAQRFYLSDRKVLEEDQYANSSYKGDTSDFLVSAQANLTKSLRLTSDYEYNFSEDVTNKFTAAARFKPEPGKVLNASYRMVLNPSSGEYDVKQYLLSGQWPVSYGWSALASYNYDIYERHDIESMLGAEYDAGCWTAQFMFHRLQLATDENSTNTFFMMLEIGDLGSFGQGDKASLFEKMNRTVKGSSFASDLPDQYREKNLEDTFNN
ncbi:LPS assembly protein LptD [Methylophilales bacterium]|nr:LPS assembly protein LptD [Methylophilales bacterium]